jgi:hypothetical protein
MIPELVMRTYALFLFAGVAVAQPAPQLSSIAGQVLHALTGQPLAGAEVILSSSRSQVKPRPATVDAQGRFAFTALEPGTYRLAARKPGFAVRSYGERTLYSPGRPLVLGIDQHLENIELRLMPRGVISGKVVDPAGEPVPRVSILATHAGAYGNQDLTETSSAETNARGEFQVPDLLPGRYFLRAIPPPLPPLDGEFLMPAYYPSGADAASAAPVILPPGQESSGVKITLRRARGFGLKGKVEGGETPLTGLTLLLSERGTASFSTTEAIQKLSERAGSARALRSDGSFELTGVEPGSYELTIGPPGKQAIGAATVQVADKDVENVVLRVESVRIAGRVSIAKEPAPPVGCGLGINPVDREIFLSTFGGSTGPDGRFTVERVLPGRYSLQIGCRTPGIYVSAVHAGGESGTRDVVDSILDIPAGLPQLSLDVVFSADAATVTGIAREGDDPAPGRWLVLVPEPAGRERALRVQTAFSGDDGRFRMPAVPPGDYRLYAWGEVLPGFLHMEPGFLQTFANSAVTVKAGAKETVQVEVQLIAPLR